MAVFNLVIMFSQLEKSILRTLVYFDLANFPLTANEAWQFLYLQTISDFRIILLALQDLKNKNIIGEKYGYYFFSGREDIVETRRTQLVISELKLNKARLAAKFLRGIPFLKAVFVCNTVSAGTAKAESDIDFFIISSYNRVWLVRFFANLILRLFGLRTYGDKLKDRICLSFFVDEHNMNLENLKALKDDIHFIYWIAQMMPIYDPQNFFKKFLSANYWIRKSLPNFNFSAQYLNLVPPNKLLSLWAKSWQIMWQGRYGDLINRQAKEWQILKMKLAVKEKAQLADNSVVINQSVIKLHESDSRAKVSDIWQKKVSSLNLI